MQLTYYTPAHTVCSYPASKLCSPPLPHCLVPWAVTAIFCGGVFCETRYRKGAHARPPLDLHPSTPTPLVFTLLSLGSSVTLQPSSSEGLGGGEQLKEHIVQQHNVYLRAMELHQES